MCVCVFYVKLKYSAWPCVYVCVCIMKYDYICMYDASTGVLNEIPDSSVDSISNSSTNMAPTPVQPSSTVLLNFMHPEQVDISEQDTILEQNNMSELTSQIPQVAITDHQV